MQFIFYLKTLIFKYSLIIFLITLKNKFSCVKNSIITLIIPIFSKSLFFSTIFHFANLQKIFELTKKKYRNFLHYILNYTNFIFFIIELSQILQLRFSYLNSKFFAFNNIYLSCRVCYCINQSQFLS